jgi:hypothetical protein
MDGGTSGPERGAARQTKQIKLLAENQRSRRRADVGVVSDSRCQAAAAAGMPSLLPRCLALNPRTSGFDQLTETFFLQPAS